LQGALPRPVFSGLVHIGSRGDAKTADREIDFSDGLNNQSIRLSVLRLCRNPKI
jgi:hypothetical protein